MGEAEGIDDYLRSLARQLAGLNRADADEVLREIESHLHEVCEARRAAGQPLDVAQLLAGFGPPERLAARYVAHVLDGRPPPRGFPALRRVLGRQVTRGLVWATALAGYGLALALMLLAAWKGLAPSTLGLWTDASGAVAVLGLAEHSPPGTRELLGGWLVAIALALSAAAAWLTRRLLAVLRPLVPAR